MFFLSYIDRSIHIEIYCTYIVFLPLIYDTIGMPVYGIPHCYFRQSHIDKLATGTLLIKNIQYMYCYTIYLFVQVGSIT